MKSLRVKRSGKRGKGVFANRAFKKGEVIIQFQGKIYQMGDDMKAFNARNNHYLQIGKKTYLGPSKMVDDFINHSCDPNSYVKIGKKIELYAMKDIEKGVEITFDYSTTMDEEYWEMDCLCGSENCRGRIKDFKYLPKIIQKKYLDLGIVPRFIQERL